MKLAKYFLLVFFLPALSASAAPSASDVLQLHVENPYISPNHDGVQDNIFFTPILKSNWNVTRWRLDVVSDKGKIVYRANGAGFSTLIQWSATDKKGDPLPEGVYHATLYAWGDGNRITSEPQAITIDTTPPLVELAVSSSTDGNGMNFNPRVQEFNPLDRWMLQFVDLNGKTLNVAWSSGSVTSVRWPDPAVDSKPVPPGPYKAVFQVWDRAGNESAPVFTDFTVSFGGNRSARGSIKKIQVSETKSGLFVRLPAGDTFIMKNGKPTLTRSALTQIEELALLVNSYPQAPVRLDGYSNARGSAASDRDLASLYAWTVYSYLVKQGSVQASRLTVRGRGRIAAEERDKETVPVLKNGVEVWLLGSGSW